jgi:hypothetical protein
MIDVIALVAFGTGFLLTAAIIVAAIFGRTRRV